MTEGQCQEESATHRLPNPRAIKPCQTTSKQSSVGDALEVQFQTSCQVGLQAINEAK